MTKNQSQTVARLRRRLTAYGAFHQLATTCSIAFILSGAWVIICRTLQPEWVDLTPSLLRALCVAVVVVTVVLTYRRRDSLQAVAAFADRHVHAGGLLLTLSEKPDQRWEPLLREKMTVSSPPRMDLDRPARRLVPAAAFWGLCLLLPSQETEWNNTIQEIGRNTVDRVEQRVDKFESAQLLPEEEMNSLRHTLESLRRAVGNREFGAAEWEAADGIQQRLTQQLEQTMSAAEASVDAARSKGNSGNAASQQSALTEALTQMDRNGLLNKLPKGMQSKALQEAALAIRDNLQLPEMTAEQLAALRRQMLQALEGR